MELGTPRLWAAVPGLALEGRGAAVSEKGLLPGPRANQLN